ncbi:Cyclolysin secretion/processing ATP-binding protein CyaB [Azospirillaceae bacterium]
MDTRPPIGSKAQESALIALTMVAGHYGVITSPQALNHALALSGEEPAISVLLAAARHIGLKTQHIKTTLDQLVALQGVFPVLASRQNGAFVIIAGIHGQNGKATAIAVVDPLDSHPEIRLEPLLEFSEYFSGAVVFVKRRYALSDPNQPFGLRWFIPEVLRQRKEFRDVAVAALMLHLIGLITPLFMQLVIDKVLVHRTTTTLYVLAIGTVIVMLFEAMFSYLRQYLLLWATNKIDIRLTTRTFNHLVALPLHFFETLSAGVTVRHMQQAEKIRQFLTGRMFLTALDTTALVVFIPVLTFYSGALTAIVLLFTGLIACVVFALIGPFRAKLQRLYTAEAERQAMLVEIITGMRTVKTLALEPSQQRKWSNKAAAVVDTSAQVGRIGITANVTTNLLEKLMSVAVIVIGAQLVFDQGISVGALIAFQMLSGRVISPLVQLVSLIQDYQETALSIRMLGHIMNHEPERAKSGGMRPIFEGRIELEGVSFRYSPDRAPALERITLQIAPDSVVGIVGRSGSGKSTLTKLIHNLYPPQEGVIRLDGIDIREIDLAHLRRSIGVVLQESFLFRGSVRENIAVTKPDAAIAEIVAAAHVAGADEFIERLPQGYDTLLEENAANLSGGQRQRLAIARAILPQPRFLILDEATSSLDPESEAIFMNNLAKIAANRTLIIVSHRLSTLVASDAILVMERGEIVDVGSHRQLLQRCEIYKHLWSQQNRHSHEDA